MSRRDRRPAPGGFNRWHADPAAGQRPVRLAPGGWLPGFRTGHADVTREAAEQFGFSPAATSILGDAAQDPDFFEWSNPAAHAQTPDEVDDLHDPGSRQVLIQRAQRAFQDWGRRTFERTLARADDEPRVALYWLGYLLHGIEDLAPHAGRTHGEHASGSPGPDHDPAAIALASSYAYQALRAAADGLGPERFDRLRRWDGEGRLSVLEKTSRAVHGSGWDLTPRAIVAYQARGRAYPALHSDPVRWSRDEVLSRVLAAVGAGGGSAPLRARALGPRGVEAASVRGAARARARPERSLGARTTGGRTHAARIARVGAAPAAERGDGFIPLAPRIDRPFADWTVMVYMAGDDANPGGIQYAVDEDLRELKRVGSTDAVHLLAQVDDAKSPEGFRYRLRADTPLAADRLERFPGDLNTGKVSTLVDFVRWAAACYPSRRYALVLWGHGSGHDDEDVYRLVRGQISPRLAAEISRQKLGFFHRTRRNLLERGATRGYGYDDRAHDFLDTHELQDAVRSVAEVLGKPLDLLGFDACLMGMIEISYQIRGCARVFVASERSEPGDGWPYDLALADLPRRPSQDGATLARAIVRACATRYRGETTLSAVDVDAAARVVPPVRALAAALTDLDTFTFARRSAVDCSPSSMDGFRDMGSFLDALQKGAPPAVREAATEARALLGKSVLAAVGGGTGLTVYAPANYLPDLAGGTDALYEQLDFSSDAGWSELLRRLYPVATSPRPRGSRHASLISSAGSQYGLDRHNAHEVLRQVLAPPPADGARDPRWSTRLRRELLQPMAATARQAMQALPPEPGARDVRDALSRTRSARRSRPRKETLRIYVVPGILGSQLTDDKGGLRVVWMDPWGLAVGRDFEALRLDDSGEHDADAATRIRASGLFPALYDRLSLALLARFGPVVEHVAYDWRHPIGSQGDAFAARIARAWGENPQLKVAVVAHSMGGLVTAAACAALTTRGIAWQDRWLGLVALGTPWQGSFDAVLALRAELGSLRTFGKLTNRSPGQLLEVVQTLWGLYGLLPSDPAWLDPAVYAPDPLRPPPRPAALQQATTILRTPPIRTLPVVSDRHPTIVAATLRDGALTTTLGSGDGTVPLTSSTNAGDPSMLRPRFVREPHALLPLDGEAVRAAIDQIDTWRGARSKEAAWAPPPAPAIVPTGHRGELLERLEHEDEITLGDVLSLMPLAGCHQQ